MLREVHGYQEDVPQGQRRSPLPPSTLRLYSTAALIYTCCTYCAHYPALSLQNISNDLPLSILCRRAVVVRAPCRVWHSTRWGTITSSFVCCCGTTCSTQYQFTSSSCVALHAVHSTNLLQVRICTVICTSHAFDHGLR